MAGVYAVVLAATLVFYTGPTRSPFAGDRELTGLVTGLGEYTGSGVPGTDNR